MDANKDSPDLMWRVIWLSRKHFQYMNSQLELIGLGSGQLPVIKELERHGAMNQRDLAEKARVTPATMSGTLKRMERAGYIAREQDSYDARATRVTLTEAGRAKCSSASLLFHATNDALLKGLDEDQLAALSVILDTMSDNVRELMESPRCERGGTT